MSETVIKENIVGARNFNSILVMIILIIAGTGFFLAGLSSYLNINLLMIKKERKKERELYRL